MQQETERDRAGKFFLKARGKNRIWYICWYNAATRQTDGITTGTTDRNAARKALYEHALAEERPANRVDAQLAAVMQSCWVKYAQHLPSAHTHLAAQNDALEVWGDPNCSELDRAKQLEFVAALRKRDLSDWTIDTRLRRVWAMMNWYKRDNPQFVVPAQITAEDWKPVLLDKQQIYALDELASLFNACLENPKPVHSTMMPNAGEWGAVPKAMRLLLPQVAPRFNCEQLDSALRAHGFELTPKRLQKAITDAVTQGYIERLGRQENGAAYSVTSIGLHPEADDRYTREHWWRFLVLAVGTASREAALRELKYDQIDLRLGRIRLNPEGRRQTKKRRPTVPIARTLAAEIASWSRDSEYVIPYYGRPLRTRDFYNRLARTAGVTGGANVIRHTVRTWLAEQGVPDSEADVFMGHKEEGSATGRRYKHRRPEYLRGVTEGIEALFDALSQLVRRPFKGRELIDQPAPDDPVCVTVRGR